MEICSECVYLITNTNEILEEIQINKKAWFVKISSEYIFDWMMRLAMTNIGSLPLMVVVRLCLG